MGGNRLKLFAPKLNAGTWPARQALVAAKSGTPVIRPSDKLVEGVSPSLSKVLRPQAAYRWLLPSLAAITPQYIEMTLRGALAGNHVQAWELFDLMEDSWPRLVKNANQIKGEVVEELKGWTARAYQEEDEAVTDSAKLRARVVKASLTQMRPDPAADENDFGGTVFDIMDGWLKGTVVLEVDYEVRKAGTLGQILAPRATYWVHPTCYSWSMEGRLGLRMELAGGKGAATPGVWQTTSSQPMPSAVADFPPDKFLIGIHKAKSGPALGGALLRSLAWWWCAANFSADWVLNLAQIFGLPLRWANYDPSAPQGTVDAICNMLQNMGSAAWAAFPAGTQIELKEAAKSAGDSPQADLLDRADKNCDLLILGQTLTSDVSQDAGSRSQGEVHERVEDKVMRSACGYVASVLNTQLIPSILRLNFGDEDEAPRFESAREDESVVAFKRECFKLWLADGSVSDVLANLTDLKQMTKDIGLTVNAEYTDPYLPVTDKQGNAVTGDLIKDPAGDIIGAGVKQNSNPQNPNAMLQAPNNLPAKNATGELQAKDGQAISDKLLANALPQLARAVSEDFHQLTERILGIAELNDPKLMEAALRKLQGELNDPKSDLVKNVLKNPASAKTLSEALTAGLFNGLAAGALTTN